MDRHDLIDRLPGSRLRQRLPSVWSPRDSEAAPASPPPDDGTDLAEAAEAADTADTTFGADATADAEDVDGEDGDRLRRLLLVLSAFGAALSVGAAVAWRLLGREETDEEGDTEAPAPEPEPEPTLPTPAREEGTAALLGLGFLAGVEALRDRLLGD